MTDYLTEQEQIQQLKNWIKEYGLTILIGVILALLITSGWHYWQNYRHKNLSHASGVYDEMLTARAEGNAIELKVQAEKLISHYPKSPYAQMAAFMLAREAVITENYTEALHQLNWVLEHTSVPAFRDIARLRIARILIATNKAPDAITVLHQVDDSSFKGMASEIEGDAYLSLNELDRAQHSYQLALKELPNPEATRPILQMKLDDLAKAV